MSWSSWSMELPPKVDYSDLDAISRDVCVQFGMMDIRAEFQLYELTNNGAHVWRCFQLWRRLMPDDLPLPPAMLAYLDDCADAVAAVTDPGELKMAFRLTQPPGDMADHGGGRSSASAAEPTRRQRNIMQFVRSELFKALIKSYPKAPPRGYKGEIYTETSKQFGLSVGHIKRQLHDWCVQDIVEADFAKWLNRKKYHQLSEYS